MKLVLMRHGDASWQAPSDSQRPLSEFGQQQVAMQAQQVLPWQHIKQGIVSPYLRTQQTFAILNAQHDWQWRKQDSALVTPGGDCAEVQELLMSLPQADTLIVTHQPLVSCLIGYFSEGDMYAGAPMMPASVAVLEGDVFARGCMHLETLIHA